MNSPMMHTCLVSESLLQAELEREKVTSNVADCCRNSSLAYSSPGKNCTLCCSTQGQISRLALFQCAQQKEWLYFMYVKLQFAPLLSYLISLYVHELILLSLTQDQRISNYLLFSFIFLF